MKIKVLEATDIQLDWLVSAALGQNPVMRHDHMRKKAADQSFTGDLAWHLSRQINEPILVTEGGVTKPVERYSTDWAQGGPLIFRENIGTCPAEGHTPMGYEIWWRAGYDSYTLERPIYEGPTPLIAATRCFVVSKLGVEVDVPEELSLTAKVDAFVAQFVVGQNELA